MIIALLAPHVAHAIAHKPQPLATQMLSIGFAIIFCITLTGVMLLFTNFLVDGLIAVLRIWWPNLCRYRPLGDARMNARISHAQVRKVALDFVLAQKRVAEKPIHSRPIFTAEAMKPNAPVQTPVVIPQFYLAAFPQGIQGPARFLCKKHSSRERGLRVAFAAVSPKDRLVFDLASAMRWNGMLKDSFIVPAGYAAREHIQTELSLLRMYEETEITKGVDFVA